MASILNFDRDINGVVASASELQQVLNENGDHCRILTPYTAGASTLAIRSLYWSSYSFQRTGWVLFSIFNLFIKGYLIHRQANRLTEEYSLFHAHDFISALAFQLSTPQNASIVMHTHFHDTPWHEFAACGYVKKNSPGYFLLRLLARRTLRHPRIQLVHVSLDNARFTSQLISTKPSPATVLYPGIKATEVENAGSAHEDYLINIGNLDLRKNQTRLIHILSELEQLGVSIPLMLVGRSSQMMRQRLDNLIQELDIKSPVIIAGEKSISETRQLLAGAKLYIHTARQESLGRTLIEAAASNTPVISLAYPAAYEILPEMAILDSKSSNRQFAGYLYYLLTSVDTLEQVRQEQFENYLNRFTPEKMLAQYNRIVEHVWS